MMKMKKSDIVKEIEAYSLRSAEPYKRWVKEVRGLQNTAVKIEEAYKAGWKDGRVSASAYGPDSDWKRWNTKATELGDEVMKHKHAENMKLFAEDALETDKPWERWEHRQRKLDETLGTWNPCRQLPAWTLDADYRRKPQKKVIDWSKVGKDVPVKFSFGEHQCISFLVEYQPGEKRKFTSTEGCGYKKAALETGIWVANVDGVNPWPEGVLVDCRLRGLKHKAAETSAEYLIWQISGGMTDIIASCCAGLQEGWSYD